MWEIFDGTAQATSSYNWLSAPPNEEIGQKAR
jgi:hypothetical protein